MLVKEEGHRKGLKGLSRMIAGLSGKESQTFYHDLRKGVENLPKVNYKKKCIISGRSRGVGRLFKVSRIVYRESGETGNEIRKVYGMKKASY